MVYIVARFLFLMDKLDIMGFLFWKYTIFFNLRKIKAKDKICF